MDSQKILLGFALVLAILLLTFCAAVALIVMA